MRFPSLIIEKASYSFAHIIGGLVVFIKTECGVILDFDSTPFYRMLSCGIGFFRLDKVRRLLQSRSGTTLYINNFILRRIRIISKFEENPDTF